MTVIGGSRHSIRAEGCHVPGDKSICHRVLVISLTMRRRVTIRNFNYCQAVAALLPAMESLGARIHQSPESVSVDMPSNGRVRASAAPLNLGNSSAAARFLLGLLAGLGIRVEIDGDSSLRHQPMNWVVEPLRALGARISYLDAEGCLPLLLEKSRIRDGAVDLGVGSSQAGTAVMLAAYAARSSVKLRVKTRARDHTERLLRHIGSTVVETLEGVEVTGHEPPAFSEYDLPGDPSAAAYLAAAHVLSDSGGDLLIRDVCINPTRLGFFRLLIDCGVPIVYQRERISFGEPVGDILIGAGPYKLKPFEIDDLPFFHSMIDEVPLAAALASRIPGRSIVSQAEELRFKETDRLLTTVEMLRYFGAVAEVGHNSLVIDGGKVLHSAEVMSFGDHRIAMAAASLACSIPGNSTIVGGACAATSFPNFDQHMRTAGFQVDFS